ncbi:54_t:CDS:2 [Funneliformis geosporum]|uniref:10543_t:CDS:1 n=1 Tax=Funneliformis geosporum TaxID=1117311 RepID=A0A9W4T873_9GLOM|nr:54_t:CDS:2 [Funneliformis geosporum]CAI2193951.1 10543_t:CDS:2 [Funneliformis geosporum]
MEILLPIVEADYFISNIGRIKNKNSRISEGSIHKGHGYAQTKIGRNNNYTPVNIHKLVAEAFISNPENKPFVNHINGIKTDNQADNLECVFPKENANRKVFPNPGRSRSRKVMQKTLDGNVIQIWDSANHAGEWAWIYYDNYIGSDPNEE